MNARPSKRHRWLTMVLLLVGGYTAQAFYDPTVGRWINRDPIGEHGGQNLYGFTLNNPTAWVDALGLSTICFNVGFDTSAQANTGNIAKLKRSFAHLSNLMTKCCNKFKIGCDIDVKVNYDYKQKGAPAGGYNGAVTPNFPSGGTGCIPVLVTTLPITQTWFGQTIRANANTQKAGVLYNIGDAEDSTLAHETGHWGNYDQGDIEGRFHHSDPNNPMAHAGGKRDDPDKCYCEKVSKLA